MVRYVRNKNYNDDNVDISAIPRIVLDEGLEDDFQFMTGKYYEI